MCRIKVGHRVHRVGWVLNAVNEDEDEVRAVSEWMDSETERA